jgi:hypothetical protein
MYYSAGIVLRRELVGLDSGRSWEQNVGLFRGLLPFLRFLENTKSIFMGVGSNRVFKRYA